MSTIEKKSLKAGKYVDREHVDSVVRTYKQERWKYNTERLGKADSLSVWYSVEELEEYLNYVKEYGADGVRFYFGAYPEDFQKVPEYAGRQTIVMVGTKNVNNGDRRANKDLYIGDGKEQKLLAYNIGALCPPYCHDTPTKPTTDGMSLQVGVTIIDQGDKGLSVI